MAKDDLSSLLSDVSARDRRRVGMRLHEIEGNPLNAEDIAMFRMFDREGWSSERRLAYIRAQAVAAAKG